MNILFLTITKIRDINYHNLYVDLVREFAKKGHVIYVFSPVEKKEKIQLSPVDIDSIHLRFVRINDYYDVAFWKKGMSSLLLNAQYKNAIKSECVNVKFDIILYATPPIMFLKTIEYVKKRDNCKTYLMLKDIWPQGMIDLGLISKSGISGIIYKYLKKQEKDLYLISDNIGCMSQGNVEYLKNHNSIIPTSKIEICPNSIEYTPLKECVKKESIRLKYGIPLKKIVFVYGGNLGKPQGIPFLIECLEKNEKTDYFIIVIGKGTEYSFLEKWFNQHKPINSVLFDYLPKDDYLDLVSACDVGLVFLNHCFSVPNIPSRILSYMEMGLPILAATDNATDLKKIIEEGEMGYWCESNDSDTFIQLMDHFRDHTVRKKMGNSANEYLHNHFVVEKSYDVIMSHFK